MIVLTFFCDDYFLIHVPYTVVIIFTCIFDFVVCSIILYTRNYSPPFNFHHFCPRCKRANLMLDEYQCLTLSLFNLIRRIQNGAKLITVGGWKLHRAKITLYTVIRACLSSLYYFSAVTVCWHEIQDCGLVLYQVILWLFIVDDDSFVPIYCKTNMHKQFERKSKVLIFF